VARLGPGTVVVAGVVVVAGAVVDVGAVADGGAATGDEPLEHATSSAAITGTTAGTRGVHRTG